MLHPNPTAGSPPPPDAALRLSAAGWRRRRSRHETRVDAWIRPHLQRSSRGEKHPVYDFLFDYYSLRPGQLRRWTPGLGVVLEDAEEFLSTPHFSTALGGVVVTAAALPPSRWSFVAWLRSLLTAVRDRPPFFGCSGLHEWAMVYRSETVRHSSWPLRFSGRKIADIVESLPVRCSHYDAFRFFTDAARPLNKMQPTRESSATLEQQGCLHAGMDLYKWSYKLLPFASSGLVASTFALAREIREADMRASPYDLSGLGFSAIPVETSEGRTEYERLQRGFSRRAIPLRAALIKLCDRMLRDRLRA